LRSNQRRHGALSAFLAHRGLLSAEVIEQKSLINSESHSKLMKNHLIAREQSEMDFFSPLQIPSYEVPSLDISTGEINSPKVFKFVENVEFDFAITFGVSILSSKLINQLHRKILGIHLGLSPFYRGSGTNFFPFVNC